MDTDDFPLFPSPFFAGLVTPRLFVSWDFYTEQLGFRTVGEGEGSVRLLHPCGAQLVLLQEEIGTTPAELVCAGDGRGFWLTLEVADARAERRRLGAAAWPTKDLPVTRWWPQGAFSLQDPHGVMVVIKPRERTGGPAVAAQLADVSLPAGAR